MTSDDHEELLTREKTGYDGAEPSGNSVQALNLLRLYELTTKDAYRKRAERTLRAFGAVLKRAPAALSEMLLAVDFLTDTPKEIIIVAPDSRSQAEPFLARLRTSYLPNRIVSVVPEKALGEHAKLVPLMEGKIALGGKTTAYVCERRVCAVPTSDPARFATQIGEVKAFDKTVAETGQSVP